MELVDCLKKVLRPDICTSDQSQDLELEEKQNGMKVRISRTGALVWALCVNTQRAKSPLSLKGGYGLICDYLIIVQSGGNDCVVFVEMKRALGGEAQEKGREQLRRSLALWDYLLSVCKIDCKIAPDVSVKYVPKYVLIAENPLDKKPTYRPGEPEVSRDQHEGIEVKTLRRTIVSIGELIN
ncbi:MAG: hypothetical protein OXU40_05350 [Nitrospira sp.]|nr:hypothetical protein [Nitrospira sp.]